ncbi:MAG: Crp/Fnr family transcriptional regulator [Ferrimicrobium sp.]
MPVDSMANDPIQILRDNPLFCRAPEGSLERALRSAKCTGRRPGEYIFREGEAADACFFIINGKVGITSHDPFGKPCMVTIKYPLELFGDLSYFDTAPRTFSAKTITPAKLLEIPYQALRSLLVAHPALLWSFLEDFARRVRSHDVMLVDALTLDLLPRLARRLLDLSEGASVFTVDLTQEELASLVGASRERTNKSLAKLVQLGALSIARRHYEICNQDILEAIALRAIPASEGNP